MTPQYTSMGTGDLSGHSFSHWANGTDYLLLGQALWKDSAYPTAKITGQEDPGPGPESLILVPGFFCSMSPTFKKSHKNSSTK